ncbi:NAD(P)-dependent oxidoreductase [Streptomyces cocklensis]|uniref:UDP-glucose 4-epimerase n=1 Tax=Actinacidiphila cocklensis TaxID=887465 RepID=A0A9W4E1C0_9ACTN|nr:NAD(P)-dependent oxidoreductase [Actinacidiphila cocklensis]MDD1062065.1 NAD(P)-dependent oxidoreductase [Actinacidiphila cocklensis]CAG6399122.1 UDP-glucose 4-epimerase [Actinacidiphila cocklensis]
MILVTGGLGFIGTHTARALLDLGESCVLLQRRAVTALPATLAAEHGTRLFTEQADLADREQVRAVGDRHRITGVVHLAGSVPWPPAPGHPVDAARAALDSLFTVVQAAAEWKAARVVVASTIGVYAGAGAGAETGHGDVDPGAAAPLGEDLPLPMTSGHVIPAFKKIGELLTDHLAAATGVDLVNARISAAWGPLGRPASVFFAAPQLVHAAARGTAPDLSALYAPAHADQGIDLIYAKDCGRALALLQQAPRLNHRTYNVASGRVTTNAEVVAALSALAPGSPIDLPPGRAPQAPADICLDITRLRQDTGYTPEYDTARAVADYLGWLRAGNAR